MIGSFMRRAAGRQQEGAFAPLRACAPYAALGVIATQLSVSALGASIESALATGVRVALGAWLLRVVFDLVRGRGQAPLVTPWGWSPSWRAIVGITLVLLVVALQRAPSRLIANLLGYAILAVPALWLASRHGGQPAAARAALVTGAFVLLPTHVDWRTMPGPELTGAETPYVWSASWPTPESALRHEVVVPAHLDGKQLELLVLLAERYVGPARVTVTANGQALAAVELVNDGTAIRSLVPGTLVRGDAPLTFELRVAPYDPRLRLLAHRWVAGATRGAAASAYLEAQRWTPGTFSAATARAQPGIYLLRLREVR